MLARAFILGLICAIAASCDARTEKSAPPHHVDQNFAKADEVRINVAAAVAPNAVAYALPGMGMDQLLFYDSATEEAVSYRLPPPYDVPAGEHSFDVSPDGQLIAVLIKNAALPRDMNAAPEQEMLVLERDGRVKIRIAAPRQNMSMPRFSVDGQSLYYWASTERALGTEVHAVGSSFAAALLRLSLADLKESVALTALQGVSTYKGETEGCPEHKLPAVLPLMFLTEIYFPTAQGDREGIALRISNSYTPLAVGCIRGKLSARVSAKSYPLAAGVKYITLPLAGQTSIQEQVDTAPKTDGPISGELLALRPDGQSLWFKHFPERLIMLGERPLDTTDTPLSQRIDPLTTSEFYGMDANSTGNALALFTWDDPTPRKLGDLPPNMTATLFDVDNGAFHPLPLTPARTIDVQLDAR